MYILLLLVNDFQQLLQELNKSFKKVLKEELGDAFSHNTAFALKALRYELLLRFDQLKIGAKTARPGSMQGPARKFSVDACVQPASASMPHISIFFDKVKEKRKTGKGESFENEDGKVEQKAAYKIQAAYKGFYQRKLQNAHLPGKLYSNI